ncbi:MAG: hypothetical protein LBJ87_02910, partial [bacterium]|nr:hypothetical protein [bacterium]
MHGGPRLNFFGRLLLVQRVAASWSVAEASEALGGLAEHRPQVGPSIPRGGLEDRPCRPHRSPQQLTAEQEAPIVLLRQDHKLGPNRIAALTRRPRSTCSNVLARHGVTGPSPGRWTFPGQRDGHLPANGPLQVSTTCVGATPSPRPLRASSPARRLRVAERLQDVLR